MNFRISDIDIRQLHVFRAVVECRGFTSAQSVLNIGQSTISNQMAQLETRLGIRLCERGRTGFELTAKGRRVYEETLKLFRAHEDFQNVTSELKGRLSGYLNIALIDNVATDQSCPIVRALNNFNSQEHEVSVRMDIMTPDDIERAVLDLDVDVAIGTFHHHVPGLEYRDIYVEVNELLCGYQNPIFTMTDADEIREAVRTSRKVTRAYLDKHDIASLGEDTAAPDAVVQHLEAAAILILGGGHIGYLPRHLSGRWVSRNEMKPILPEEYVYKSNFSIVTRKAPRKSMILKTFLASLAEATEDGARLEAA